MTAATATLPEPPPEVGDGPNIPIQSSDSLMHLIVAFLAPMFMGVSSGDIGLARMAAIEAVNAYHVQNQADLIVVAQIIAFGLAALGSLSRSMADDLTVAMTLRLRGNANALNRSAEQNRRALRDGSGGKASARQPAVEAEPETWGGIVYNGLDEAEVLLDVAAARELAMEAQARLYGASPTAGRVRASVSAPSVSAPSVSAPSASTASGSRAAARMEDEGQHQAMWAMAMVSEAEQITADLLSLPPAERRIASIQAAALSEAANSLLTGGRSPPINSRANSRSDCSARPS